MERSIETLFERDAGGAGSLPAGLREKYGGDLRLPAPPDRPYVVANFVSTLDGVVSFEIPGESGGAPISGADPGDRFIMGLLRASADAVLVGSGTVRAVSHGHLWIAGYIYPPMAELYGEYRKTALGKPEHPLTVIVSGSGRLDLGRAVFQTAGIAVLVLTTEAGRDRLLEAGAGALPSTTVRVAPANRGRIAPAAILGILKDEFGAGLVLHEGGPALFGQFLAERFVDELFLTLAPRIAGRSPARPRPALVTDLEYSPATAPWLDLLSAKRGGNHLYLRYGRAAPQ